MGTEKQQKKSERLLMGASSDNLFFSIITPTFNRAHTLNLLFENNVHLQYPKEINQKLTDLALDGYRVKGFRKTYNSLSTKISKKDF